MCLLIVWRDIFISALVAYVCGYPQKVPEKIFNAFEWDKIEKLKNIIEKEKKENGENI